MVTLETPHQPRKPSEQKPSPPEYIVGYKPETLLHAPIKPPTPAEAKPADTETPKQLSSNHNVFGLALIMSGVGLLAIGVWALLFLPDTPVAVLLTLWIFGGSAIFAGLIFDIIYRKSYKKM